jgi:hypothetical protein
LEDRFVELDAVGPDGGLVRITGPLGIFRVARTRVIAADEPTKLRGTAEIGRRTHAAVRWEIVPAGAGSRVTLSARVERTSALDRLLLALGGRRWLQQLFQSAVERLDSILAKPIPAGAAACLPSTQ